MKQNGSPKEVRKNRATLICCAFAHIFRCSFAFSRCFEVKRKRGHFLAIRKHRKNMQNDSLRAAREANAADESNILVLGARSPSLGERNWVTYKNIACIAFAVTGIFGCIFWSIENLFRENRNERRKKEAKKINQKVVYMLEASPYDFVVPLSFAVSLTPSARRSDALSLRSLFSSSSEIRFCPFLNPVWLKIRATHHAVWIKSNENATK